MGVTGLHTFMENSCREAIIPVNIGKMAADYRNRHNKEPVIVVDGMACIRKIYGSELSWIHGGQWREYIENLKNFIKAFKKIDVGLVFIFDGCVVTDKRPIWVSRRKQDMQKIKTIFDIIKKTAQEPSHEHFQIPAALGSLTPLALKHQCGAEVHLSLGEADIAIYEYAESKSCFAILSQDTDFLIFNTVPYLSVTEFNINTMETVMYDRRLMAKRLGLRIEHLPIFSSLVGNDVIPVRDLYAFHQWLNGNRNSNPRGKQVILSVALYINQVVFNQGLNDVIGRIAWDVFQDHSKERTLRDSIESYGKNERLQPNLSSAASCPNVSTKVLQLALQRHTDCENAPTVYNVLRGLEYESSSTFEDNDNYDIPSCSVALLPIRLRLYGLLLGVKTDVCVKIGEQSSDKMEDTLPPPPKKGHIISKFSPKGSQVHFSNDAILGVNAVKEWCVFRENPLLEPNIMRGLPLDIPGVTLSMDSLWFDSADRNLLWQSFLSCMHCSDMELKELQKVKACYVLPVCLLHYMLLQSPESMLLASEVDAFLSQALTLPDSYQLKKLCVKQVDSRAVQLAALFIRGVSIAINVIGACNYPITIEQAMPSNYFDGKLFHHKFLLAKQGVKVEELCEHKMVTTEEFFFLKKLVVTGTRLSDSP